MSFLTPTLLAGIALIAVPIALHLAMRRQPKQLTFPALRLLKRNKRQNETRLRLRRWILLLMRCAAVALLALALARPVLLPPQTEGKGAAGVAGTGLAVAVVIDNGPSSEYRFGNLTRLKEARESALGLLETLPSEAVVITADRNRSGPIAAGDPDSAALRLERLATATATRSLGAAVREAVNRLAEAPVAQRVACVFTDLSESAWTDDSLEEAAEALQRLPGLVLRVVDVGAQRPLNIGVADLSLANESPVVGEPLRLVASIEATGQHPDSAAIQLWLDGNAPGQAVKRDERRIELDKSQGAIEASFSLEGLEEGIHSGYVQVVAGDALSIDDRSYFCVRVKERPSLLLSAQRGQDAIFVREALSPTNPPPGVAQRFDCRVVRHDQLARTDWGGDSAVLLLDPPPFEAREWRRLADYAAAGGGVGLFLGRNTRLESFNQPVVQSVAPAKLRWTSRDETYLRPADYAHPAIAPLSQYAEAIPWAAFPVFKRWELESLNEGALVVAQYADTQPAIVERELGRGRIVMMTTPLSDRLDETDPWNLLPTGEDPWPFFLLIDALTDHMSGSSEERLNHTAGDAAVVHLPPELDLPSYVLRTPENEALRQTVPPGTRDLTIGFATDPGVYWLEAGGREARLARRFAVNLKPNAVRLERIPFSEMDSALGADRVVLIRDRDALARSIDQGRVGRELYGLTLALVAAAFAAEQIISNRFYRERAAIPGKGDQPAVSS